MRNLTVIIIIFFYFYIFNLGRYLVIWNQTFLSFILKIKDKNKYKTIWKKTILNSNQSIFDNGSRVKPQVLSSLNLNIMKQ